MKDEKKGYGTIPEKDYIKSIFKPLYAMAQLMLWAGIFLLLQGVISLLVIALRWLPYSEIRSTAKAELQVTGLIFAPFLIAASVLIKKGWRTASAEKINKGIDQLKDCFSWYLALILIGILLTAVIMIFFPSLRSF